MLGGTQHPFRPAKFRAPRCADSHVFGLHS
jgi:hypothetical protein